MIQNDYLIDIKVVTLNDNLEHPYFSYITWNNDNSYPVGNASLVTLFNDSVLNYWKSYKGVVVISAELKDDPKINTNSSKYYDDIVTAHYKKKIKNQQLADKLKKQKLKNENKKQHHTQDKVLKIPKNNKIINDEYNFSFIGTIKKTHQRGQEIIIRLQDIGWKFSQYVPKDFRDKYVANQKVNDVFQAICEFMGVDFAYSIEDLNQYTFAADGYSIQKDGKTIERNPTIDEEFSISTTNNQVINQDDGNCNDDNCDKNIDTSSNKKNKNDETSVASAAVNQQTNTSYSTPLSTNESNDNIYQEEFEEKIRDLFIGNSYYESDLISSILNYNQITIQPSSTSTSSSSMSKVGNENNNEQGNNNEGSNQNNKKSSRQQQN